MDDRFWERGDSPERTERTDWDDVADLITDEGARVFARGEDRRDWTLDQWIDWGVETVRDAPIFHPPHWQVVVAEAFRTCWSEGSSYDWGVYLQDVAEEIDEGTFEGEDRELELFEPILPRPVSPTFHPLPREPERGEDQDPASPASSKKSDSDNEDPDDEFLLHGGAIHKENVLKALGLKDDGHSLQELADASGISKSILQKVYNRGIGAYKTNPTSVRMKGTFKKGVDAPMSKKLSKEQWGMSRVYSFIDGNPKHDQDLRGGVFQNPPQRTPEEVRRISTMALNFYRRAEIQMLRAILNGNEEEERRQERRMREIEDQWAFFHAQIGAQLQQHLATRADDALEAESEALAEEVERREQNIERTDSMRGGVRHIAF